MKKATFVITLIGLIASIIAIIVFFSGKSYFHEFYNKEAQTKYSREFGAEFDIYLKTNPEIFGFYADIFNELESTFEFFSYDSEFVTKTDRLIFILKNEIAKYESQNIETKHLYKQLDFYKEKKASFNPNRKRLQVYKEKLKKNVVLTMSYMKSDVEKAANYASTARISFANALAIIGSPLDIDLLKQYRVMLHNLESELSKYCAAQKEYCQ